MQGNLLRYSFVFLLLHKFKSSTCTDLVIFLHSFEYGLVSCFADIRTIVCGSFDYVLQIAVALLLVSMGEKSHDDIPAHIVDVLEVSWSRGHHFAGEEDDRILVFGLVLAMIVVVVATSFPAILMPY